MALSLPKWGLTSDLYYSWWAQHSPPPKWPILDIYDITHQINFFPVLKHFSVLKGTFILVLFLFFSKVQKTGTQLFRDCLRLWFCFLFPQLNSFEVLVCVLVLFSFFPRSSILWNFFCHTSFFFMHSMLGNFRCPKSSNSYSFTLFENYSKVKMSHSNLTLKGLIIIGGISIRL